MSQHSAELKNGQAQFGRALFVILLGHGDSSKRAQQSPRGSLAVKGERAGQINLAMLRLTIQRIHQHIRIGKNPPDPTAPFE